MLNTLKGKINSFGKSTRKAIKPLFLMLNMLVFCLPHASASQDFEGRNKLGPIADSVIKSYYDSPSLPNIGPREPSKTMYIMVTAYNSEPGQTDDSPFTTAFGTHVRDGIVATNFLPKGTIVRFPEKFGDKEFVVEDRMNARYYYHMDIWMADKPEAIKFGARFLKMEIL